MVSRWWIWLIIGLCLGAGVASAAILAVAMPMGQASVSYVALVQLSGTIAYSESPLALLSGETLTPSEVEELVGRIESDPFAEAIVLVINSPGGSAAASEEIYHMIKRLADDRVVIAYISEYGASGGYYIALPTDEIIASPHALTGSVGAVSLVINWAELMGKLGIKVETFKSGELKDIGSAWRPMTDEERRIMQDIINRIAGIFADRAREARGDKIRNWDEVLSARPYLGAQAAEIGLVDKVGSLEDAISEARRLAGLPETAPARWIKPRAPSLLELLLGGRSSESMKLSYEVLMMWPLPSGIDPSLILEAAACSRS
ncbi:MAG: signal peptide peptidase SppA [Aigarchaeota archaeon]|nr:signal peptide peptidase SppA [Candidatus Wolframiiraptor gerlachensis]